MLELIAVKKSFNGTQVLNIPHRSLFHGMYWLQGTNGSGKSTLLKIMSGLLPFSGDIRMNNTVSLQKQPVIFRKQINYSPAEPQFPPFITGQELVNFTRSVKEGNDAQITAIRELLQIGDFIHNPTGTYSSGMLKKLSLLLAFIGKPQWILLDEPFTTLDHTSQEALEQLIVNTHQQKNIAFILTSHHDIEASHIAFTEVFRISNQGLTIANNIHAH